MPSTHDTSVGTPRLPALALIFVGLAFVAGNINPTAYPVFAGSILASGRVTTAQIGVLGMAEYLTYGLAVMLAGKWVPLRHIRLITLGCALAQLASAYASVKLPFELVVLCRAAYGTASGLLVWIAYAFIARTAHPGRLAGIYSTVQMIAGVVCSYVGPTLILPSFGHVGVILFLASFSTLALFLLPFTPDELPEIETEVEDGSSTGNLSLSSLLVLLSVGLWSAYIAIFWIFGESLAGFHHEPVMRNWVTLSLIAGIAGAGSAALLVNRLPARPTISMGLLISLFQIAWLMWGVDGLGFVINAIIFSFFGMFLVAFYVNILAEVDPTRRSVVYFPAAQFLPAGLGPLVASFFVSMSGLQGGLLVDLAAICLAMLLFWGGLVLARRGRAAALVHNAA